MFEAFAAHAAVSLGQGQDGRAAAPCRRQAHEALHDPLTSLRTVGAFSDAVQEAMTGGEPAAVLLLDLDDFKDVNDTLGHSAVTCC